MVIQLQGPRIWTQSFIQGDADGIRIGTPLYLTIWVRRLSGTQISTNASFAFDFFAGAWWKYPDGKGKYRTTSLGPLTWTSSTIDDNQALAVSAFKSPPDIIGEFLKYGVTAASLGTGDQFVGDIHVCPGTTMFAAKLLGEPASKGCSCGAIGTLFRDDREM